MAHTSHHITSHGENGSRPQRPLYPRNNDKLTELEMDLYGATKTKYDVPLNHLDFSYIKSCQDKKELEKIVKILRSGKEGTYPELEACAEKQLASLEPGNKLLRKPDTLKTAHDIDKEEWKQIDEELKSWMADVKSSEHNLEAKQCIDVADEDSLPPVRSSSQQNHAYKKQSQDNKVESAEASKRAKPREYREWDKFDVDAELNKVDDVATAAPAAAQEKTSSKSSVPDTVETAGMSDELKEMKAEREKNKGNEAFRAGDFDEALVYYSRSLSLLKTVAAHNNRAQTYLKLKQWNNALDDCEAVLAIEPANLKAVMRRAVAYKSLTRYVQAKQDLEMVLEKEPNNRQALAVMKEVDKALADQKVSGRRMVIEEVEGSEDEEPVSAAGQDLPASAESSDDRAEEMVNGTDTNQKHKVLTDKADDRARLQDSEVPCYDIQGGGDARGPGTKAGSQSQSFAAKGDTTSPAEGDAVSPDDNLPPAVLALKDAGNGLFRNGQYGDALDKYNAAVQLLDGSGNTAGLSVLYSNRAACLMKLGDCQGCIADCDSALALCPDSPKPLLRRAMAFEALEKYRKAFVDYRLVLSLTGNSDIAQQGSDRCSAMLQQLDGPRWREKLPSIPSTSSLTSLTTLSSASDLASAGSNETTFETCKTEGNALFSKGEFTKAIELFTKCVELFPDRVVPYTNRALCYLRVNEYESVLSDCNQALSLEFHNVKALFRRAQAYKMLQRYEESMVDLETLLKIDPNNSAAKKELQLVLRSKEDEREKRLEACLRKHRQRVHIEEVDNSSDEEESKNNILPCSKKMSLGHSSNTADNSKSSGSAAASGKISADSVTALVARSEDNSVSAAAHTSSSSHSSSAAPPPQLSKVTAFEFMQAWNSLKGITDIEQYVYVLDQIQPADIPKVVSNKLEGDLLILLVRCCSHLIMRGDHCKAFDFLREISTLPRFDTIVLFLSDAENKEIQDVFHQLSQQLVDEVLLVKTKQKYGL